MRQSRVMLIEVGEDGTIEVPDDATVISLEFESEGSYGFKRRPVAAWVEVPVGAS
jgi:hypothetical protein